MMLPDGMELIDLKVEESEQMVIIRRLLLFSRVVRAAKERHTSMVLSAAAMFRLQILTVQKLSPNAQQAEKPGRIFNELLVEKVIVEAFASQETHGKVPSFAEQLSSSFLAVALALQPAPLAPLSSHKV